MATTKAKPELTLDNPNTDEEFEKVRAEVNDTAARLESQEAEIARLKMALEEANRRSASNTPEEVRQRVKELAEEAAENGKDPWKISVPILIPRRPPTEDPWYWINVNGRSVQIPANNKVQDVLLPWAEVLVKMLEAEDMTRRYADSIQSYDPITNPKTV